MANKRSASTMALLILGVILIAVLSLPALAAVVYMVSTNDVDMSAGVCVQLAILATLLSVSALWFSTRSSDSGENMPVQGQSSIRGLGALLLIAAFCFTMLAFLSPWLPDPGTTNHFYNFALRLAGALNLLIGTICLITSLCWGMWIIWSSMTR